MIDITNELITKLKTDLKNVDVRSPYSNKTPNFPMVTFNELNNTTFNTTITNDGEQHSYISFEINIFTNSKTKESDCKAIRNKVDNIMTTFYKMNRDDSRAVENYADPSIFRWVLRYSCVVGLNEKIYRR